jgi:two-component system sensor histidine kinase ArlS
MNQLRSRLSRLPMKWKLTLGASLIFILLFMAYNIAQYVIINQWLIKEEERAIQKNMDEIQVYFQEKNAILDLEQIRASKSFIEKAHQRDQLIRILDEKGNPVVTQTDETFKHWIAPRPVTRTLLSSEWNREEHFLVIRSPLVTPKFTGTIEIMNNLEKFDNINDILTAFMLAGAFGAILLSFLGGTLLSHQLLKPIHNLMHTIAKIKRNGLQERVYVPDNSDEISRLGTMFNDMMERLETSFLQQEQFVEDASHELRTPIAIIEGHLSLLNRWGKNDPMILEESLQASLQEVKRLKELVQELLKLTQADTVSPDAVDDWVEPSVSIPKLIKSFNVPHPDFQFETDLSGIEGEKIHMAPHHLEQTLLILLDNAVKYSLDHKVIRMKGSLLQDHLQIEVKDYGMGIPESELPHVFNRFYRVDKARSRSQGGNGLGLSIAKRLVEKYRGTIEIYSSKEGGTGVILSFPEHKSYKKE